MNRLCSDDESLYRAEIDRYAERLELYETVNDDLHAEIAELKSQNAAMYRALRFVLEGRFPVPTRDIRLMLDRIDGKK